MKSEKMYTKRETDSWPTLGKLILLDRNKKYIYELIDFELMKTYQCWIISRKLYTYEK